MMLHAASPTPPDLPFPLRHARGAGGPAAGGMPTTPPFTLQAPMSAFSGLEGDDEAASAEPEADGPVEIGAVAAASEVIAVEAALTLQSSAVLAMASNPPMPSAADAAPAPPFEAAAEAPGSTVRSAAPAGIDANPVTRQPDSRTPGMERPATGESQYPVPTHSAIDPGSGQAALPHAPQAADTPPASPVLPLPAMLGLSSSSPRPAGHPALPVLPAAPPAPGERAVVLSDPVFRADVGPAALAAVMNEPGTHAAAEAARSAPVAHPLPAFPTGPAPIAMGGTTWTEVPAAPGGRPVDPSAASPGMPRALAEQAAKVERAVPGPAVAADDAVPALPSAPEETEQNLARIARGETAPPSPARSAAASSIIPPTAAQPASSQAPAERTSATLPPTADSSQPQRLPHARTEDSAPGTNSAEASAKLPSQTGPFASELGSPRGSAGVGDAETPAMPQFADAAEPAAPPEAPSEATAPACPPAPLAPPAPRLLAEASQQPPALAPIDLGSDAQWTERVSLDISALIDGPARQLRFKLRPVTLGEMAISVETERDRLRVAVVVESREAHAIVTRDLDQLRAAVQQQGLRLDHASVELAPSAGPPAAEANMGGASGWASQHRQPLPAPGADGPVAAPSPEAKPQAPTRPGRTATGGRIDVYA